MLRRHDFDQQLVAARLHGVVQSAHLRLVLESVDDVVVGVQRHEALDHMFDRPRDERGPDRSAMLEDDRIRTGPFDRPADPPAPPRRRVERVLPIAVVAQEPDAARQSARLLGLGDGPHEELLQLRQPALVCTGSARHFEKRVAVVECKDEKLRSRRARGGHPMEACELDVLVGLRDSRGVRDEMVELDPRGHGRRASVPRNDERAARVGVTAARVVILAAQPSGQEPGAEGVARAQHVQHLDAHAATVEGVVERCGNGAVDHGAAHRATLDDERGRRDAPRRLQRSDDVGAAARDRELLLGADHEVECRQHRLQVGGHRVTRDEARLAVAALGQPPEHGAVVDVEDGANVVRPCSLECQAADAMHVRRREVGAGDEQRLRLGQEIGGDVVVGDRHVGAVLAIEDQRKRVAVLDPQHHARGQPGRIDADVRDVAAFASERLDEKAAHRVVAHARGHRRVETEPRAAERRVGRRAAEVFGEARDVLEPRTDLLCVEINRKAAEADDVETAPGCEMGVVLHGRKQRPRCESGGGRVPVT